MLIEEFISKPAIRVFAIGDDAPLKCITYSLFGEQFALYSSSGRFYDFRLFLISLLNSFRILDIIRIFFAL